MKLCLHCIQTKPLGPAFLLLRLFCVVQSLLLNWFYLHSFKDPWNNCMVSNLLTVCWWPPWSACQDAPGLKELQPAWQVRAFWGIFAPAFSAMCFLLLLKKKFAGCISEMIPVKNGKPESIQTPDALPLSFRWQKTHSRVISSCLSCGLDGPGSGCSCQQLPKPCSEPSFCVTLALSALIAGRRRAYMWGTDQAAGCGRLRCQTSSTDQFYTAAVKNCCDP